LPGISGCSWWKRLAIAWKQFGGSGVAANQKLSKSKLAGNLSMAPDDSPMLIRDTSIEEIYALTVNWP
jgi:hypothetical protein